MAWPGYCLAAILVFLYNDWILEYFLNPRVSLNRSLISDLSALNQPYHWVFQALDILAGIVTLGCVAYMWRFTAQISPSKRWLLLALFVFIGLDSIVDASLPISCAAYIDPNCTFLGATSIITKAHLVESNIDGTVIAFAPLVWWWLHRSDKHRHISLASLWLIAIESAVGMAALIVRFTHHSNYGGIQRVYQVALGVWVGLLVYTAITVHVEGRRTTSSKRNASKKADDTGTAS